MPHRTTLQEPERLRRLFTQVLLPGALAGLTGAGVMVVLAMLTSAIAGESAFRPAWLISTVFFRHGRVPSEAAWLGLVIHIWSAPPTPPPCCCTWPLMRRSAPRRGDQH